MNITMNEEIDKQINEVGRQINIIYTLVRALMSCILGTEVLTTNDSSNLIILLEEKIRDLKLKQDKIINEMEI